MTITARTLAKVAAGQASLTVVIQQEGETVEQLETRGLAEQADLYLVGQEIRKVSTAIPDEA